MAREQLTLPGTNEGLTEPEQAPCVRAGSFLVEPGGDFQVVRLSDGRERYLTPVDHTGLPYCFAPSENADRVQFIGGRLVSDLNHQFPKYGVRHSKSPILQDELPQSALINARGQVVDYEWHHRTYNRLFTDPPHPQNQDDLAYTLIMAAAGYIPEYALDLSGGEAEVVRLSKKQRKDLWTSGQVLPICPSVADGYLRDYVLEAEVDHLDQLDIEEFLYTFDYERRLELGHKLSAQIIQRVADPIETAYRNASKKNLLSVMQLGREVKQAPKTAAGLLKAKLTYGRRRGPAFNDLQQRLAQTPRRPFKKYFEEQGATA